MGVVGSFLMAVGVWRYLVGKNKWRANAKLGGPVPENPRNRTRRYYYHNGEKAQDIASMQTAEKAEKSSRSPLCQAPG